MKKNLLAFVFVAAIGAVNGQPIAKLELQLQKPLNGITVPAHVNLDELTHLPDSVLSLIKVDGNGRKEVPFQIKHGEHRTLYWFTGNSRQGKQVYELVRSSPQKFDYIHVQERNGVFTFIDSTNHLLSYVHKTVYPPAGIDTAYKRSGFIHPLYTPNGQELTRIQPKDHYHHYGIWNPWTHVYFEGDTLDFWNLKDRKGTVRSAKILSQTHGPVFSEIKALHEHVALKKSLEKVALNEVQTIRVYKPSAGENYYLVDIISEMNCATASPFLIVEYRYAGMGWRTTEYWDNNNAEVLTSEGKNRANTDATRARWCIVQGQLPGNAYGGAAFLSYPTNFNHPEPMRIWAPNTNGRGDMFFSFAPTKDRNWLLEPGKTYTLQYRLVVYNNKLSADRAESAWQYYATPPKARVTLYN